MTGPVARAEQEDEKSDVTVSSDAADAGQCEEPEDADDEVMRAAWGLLALIHGIAESDG